MGTKKSLTSDHQTNNRGETVRKSAISLLVGKHSYSFTTSLDDERLSEVHDLVQDIINNTDNGLEQDERLFLTCMILASELTSISARLKNILDTEDSKPN